MKKITAFAAALLLATGLFAQDAKNIYNKYSEEKGVSSVYISPAMFKMIGRLPDLEINDEDVNISSIVESLTGLYIIEAESPSVRKKLIDDVNRFVKTGKFELILEAKDDGETVRMYSTTEGNFITSWVMLAIDDDDATFISFCGRIPEEEFSRIIASTMN